MIGARGPYVKEKQARMARLQDQAARDDLSLVEQFNIYNRLYNEYRSFQYDSAFTYAQKLQETARQLQDTDRITHARLNMSFILLSSGMFKEAFDTLNAVKLTNRPDSIKID